MQGQASCRRSGACIIRKDTQLITPIHTTAATHLHGCDSQAPDVCCLIVAVCRAPRRRAAAESHIVRGLLNHLWRLWGGRAGSAGWGISRGNSRGNRRDWYAGREGNDEERRSAGGAAQVGDRCVKSQGAKARWRSRSSRRSHLAFQRTPLAHSPSRGGCPQRCAA